jgi:hypothetical protein
MSLGSGEPSFFLALLNSPMIDGSFLDHCKMVLQVAWAASWKFITTPGFWQFTVICFVVGWAFVGSSFMLENTKRKRLGASLGTVGAGVWFAWGVYITVKVIRFIPTAIKFISPHLSFHRSPPFRLS